jgi:hypothetical protein
MRRENEKSVDSRFLKNVWGIRNLHTRGYMGNKAKSQFCSVLLNEFHHRTKLMAPFFSDFVFKSFFFEILSRNGSHGVKMFLTYSKGTIWLIKVLSDLS